MQSFSFKTIIKVVLLLCLIFHFVFFIIFEVPGCYKDSWNRVLESGPYNPYPNGKTYCRSYCKKEGQFRYYGLEACINLGCFCFFN